MDLLEPVQAYLDGGYGVVMRSWEGDSNENIGIVRSNKIGKTFMKETSERSLCIRTSEL